MPTNNELVAGLKLAIAGIKGPNKVRVYGRRVLGLKGDGFKRVSRWIADPAQMTSEEASLVARVLNLGKSELVTNDGRYVIDHTVSLLTSIRSLLGHANVRSTDINDSDRMYTHKALQDISAAFGIKAVFTDLSSSKSRPATREDLVKLGFKKR